MEKKLKVNIGILLFMICSLVFAGLYITNVLAARFSNEQRKIVTIHYHRYDRQYEGWNLWSWPKGGEGSAYYMEEDEFGSRTSIDVTDMQVDELGLIVRLNDWEARDVDGDRFIDLTKIKDGILDVYLVQGDSNVYYSKDEIDLSPKFLSARFMTAQEIEFQVTVPIDTSSEEEKKHYRLTDESGKEYAIQKIWAQEEGLTNTASLVLEEALDFKHSYTLYKEGYGSIIVSMGDAFSTPEFEQAFTYTGTDLGAVYSKNQTVFKVWAPTASAVQYNLYEKGAGDNLIKTIDMIKTEKGIWSAKEMGDCKNLYYTYTVTAGEDKQEAVDLYAKGVGVNGQRGMIIDLENTNPANWNSDKKPEFKAMTDAVIYELHVRDLSSDKSSGIKDTGKFSGLTESGTKNQDGLSTGLDHMKDLGVTHVHLLPSFDYASVDETKLDVPQFNWGYDPVNYNVPEGSYSTDPTQGAVRVKEYKQMVQKLHNNGLRVIMDVVYNHTAATGDSNFNKIVPDYYYRKIGPEFSNASACGNETASERSMMRKYIVDSVVYWATEYHVDGFRFDLMGIHDIETMNAVRKALDEVDPSIIVYGEGWAAGASPYPEVKRALKSNMRFIPGVAAFSDDIRDSLKGSVFNHLDRGFVSGKPNMEESVKFGVAGATKHEQINIDYWAGDPTQSINYVSAHDNLTLWDKLASSNPKDTADNRIKMNKLAAAVVMTSQGIPFFQAGEELMRSKPTDTEGVFDENSYCSPDEVNSIKWNDKKNNLDVYEYYKGLIEFRKAHGGFRMTTTDEIQASLKFMENQPENVVAYTIDNKPNGEISNRLMVVYNANKETVDITLADGTWELYVNGEKAGLTPLATLSGGRTTIDPISCFVYTQNDQGGIKEEVPFN